MSDDVVRVPVDLIDDLSLPQHKRLQVTAWVLSWPDASSRETYHEARRIWPELALRRPGNLTVLSILIELEVHGVCEVLDEDGVYICVSRGRKVGVA